MSETNNPLAPPVEELFARLNLLYGLIFHLKSQLDSFRKMTLHQLEKSGFDVSVIRAGSAVVIRDLTEWPEDNWARYYPTGSFTSQGEEYLQMVDVLLTGESAWVVSQAYEAFETFLKDIAGFYLYLHPDCADERKLRKAEGNLSSSGLRSNEIEYWRRFTRLAYRSNDALLDYLGGIAPEIEKAEQHNNRGIDLTDWFAAVSEVRHAVVHSSMIVKPSRLDRLSNGARRLLVDCFPGSNTDAGYQLSIGVKKAKFALKLFGEYALLVFKCLSEKQRYDWKSLIRPAAKGPA